MELTEERTVGIAIELWEWVVATGNHKSEWPGWEKYGRMMANCPLCEYGYRIVRNHMCRNCPYAKRFGYCTRHSSPYYKYLTAGRPKTKEEYAKLFLKQLKQLKKVRA